MQAIPSTRTAEPARIRQIFSYPFRVFFLSMAILSVTVIPLWVLTVTGTITLPLALPGLIWHQHEMLFGFLSAAIAGFLLTAVCVWTQTARLHGLRLAGLWGVWLAGRLLLAFGAGLPDWLVLDVNLAFLPLVGLDAGWRIWKARQRRQLMILVVLGLLWLMQIGFLLRMDMVYSHGALIMAMALIGIIGGRITPAFSGAWLRQRGHDASGIRVVPALDMASIITMILLLAAMVSGWTRVTGVLALTAAVLMAVRLIGWKGWLVRREPLLWSLHLSILWVPVSLLLLAGSSLAGWPSTAWSHAAGAGAVGCLVLAVIARVSLGHTGRPLALPRGLVTAFVAIQVAAALRVLTAFSVIPWQHGIAVSAFLWIFAYGIFLFRYAGILSAPRPDGREG